MDGANNKSQLETGPTQLEQLLRLQSDFRRSLGPMRVTPAQAGVIPFLSRLADARITDSATALGVSLATLGWDGNSPCAKALGHRAALCEG